MLYPAHEAQRFGLKTYFNALSAGLAFQEAMLAMQEMYGLAPKPYADLAKDILSASHEMSERFAKDYTKPEFNLKETQVDGKAVTVTEEIIEDRAFGSLLHFKRDTNRNDPKLLIVAPMSGHYATLLRDTVAEMLPNHDVYITDWKDARDVPLSKGEFGLDDYIGYVKGFIEKIGPGAHVMAVCQPTVATLAAVSLLAEEKSPCQPVSMTLMGGPLDTRAAKTEVTKLAESKPIEWFEENLIGQVPVHYKGAGRFVYPGFVQLFSFMAMHPEKHMQSHVDMFNHLMKGNHDKADKIKAFYDEYLAVCDLPGKFYLETVQKVFIDQQLAKGTLEYDGKLINPAAVKHTALLTIEGEKDDISAPGQTTAAHKMCAGLKLSQKFHYQQPGAGHYGIFAGSGWRDDIAPRITAFIREMAARHNLSYDLPSKSVMPETFAPLQDNTPRKAGKPPRFGT
ncbi:MAG: polyhydroxyalkanoate depolymerase [Alphaproteobacteria bacterium]|nr:MAG: polyhydroxyalkanoate depolymerase [Alphaproteobacteria bacterium]